MLLLTIVLLSLSGTGAFYGYDKSKWARPKPLVVWARSFQSAGSD